MNIEEVKDQRAKGMTYKAIAGINGVSKQRVYAFVHGNYKYFSKFPLTKQNRAHQYHKSHPNVMRRKECIYCEA